MESRGLHQVLLLKMRPQCGVSNVLCRQRNLIEPKTLKD